MIKMNLATQWRVLLPMKTGNQQNVYWEMPMVMMAPMRIPFGCGSVFEAIMGHEGCEKFDWKLVRVANLNYFGWLLLTS
jgi:hypothetical protein